MHSAGRFLTMRLALLLACVLAVPVSAVAGQAATITSATYGQPTTRYQHGVLGDTIEYGALELRLSDGSARTLTLPKSRVFEDLAPRLVDVDLDGDPEIIAVESSLTLGARLSIYDENGLLTATPYIGRSHRWLAPIGAADLDGDGHIEIAYIDRPHLAKTLRIWRYKSGQLINIANQSGYTNHRIGWDFILGGIRECANDLEIITASGNWSQIMATKLSADGQLISSEIGSYDRPEDLTSALTCP